MEVDTVPYGCWPRWVFERVGYFDERLVRNQDIEMNARIRRAGGKIYLLPHAEIYYRSAADLGSLVRYMFRNGEWNILTFRLLKVRRFLSLRHFVPMFFVIGLIISLFLGFIKSIFFYVFVLIVLSYSVLAIFFSVRYGRRDWWRMFVGYWVLHLSYGFGELVGIVESLKRGDY
jgi:GT2 family glycosyltransferase